ncbi:MAG: glycosyltransferase family 4 protein [Candidatus Woesearchaeota archaeon]
MIIAYHNYRLSNEFFIDGANYYYIENSRLVSSKRNASVFAYSCESHNIADVIKKPAILSKLKSEDAVLANTGPYAFIYHYLREKHGFKFRIIRDVQTGFWPGYLFQELMCTKYLRDGDKVMFLSEFARQLYIKLFPQLNKENTTVCAPFMHFFPEKRHIVKKKTRLRTLGWVGRINPEKGFDIVLDAFINLYKMDSSIRLLAAGYAFPHYKKKIYAKLRKNDIPLSSFLHFNGGHFTPYTSIWEVYKRMDVLLFPSTSLNESLGRVIIEAGWSGVPVVAAFYGAAPEILPSQNLVDINFRKGLLQLDSANPYNWGDVDFDRFIEKIIGFQQLKPTNISVYKEHHQKFFSVLSGTDEREKLANLHPKTKQFISNVKLYNNQTSLDDAEVYKKMSEFMLGWFVRKGNLNSGSAKYSFSIENFYLLKLYNFFLPYSLKYNPYTSLENPGKMQEIFLKIKKPAKPPVKWLVYYYVRKMLQGFKP